MPTETEIKTDTALSTVVTKHLAFEVGKAIIDLFDPFYARAAALAAEAGAIAVTDATQVSEIKASREMRLKLRTVRTGAENARKTAKEESLKRSQAIDAAARVIADLCEPVEARLLEQEQFAERAEAKRKAALAAERGEALRNIGGDPSLYQLGDMKPTEFEDLMVGLKAAHEKRVAEAKAQEEARKAEEARRAEELRIAREKAAAAEAEAAKARAEQAEAERKAKAEREALEAKARREREAAEAEAAAERRRLQALADVERQKREAAEKAQREREAEEKRQREAQEKAAKKAAAAPDADKLRAFAKAIEDVPTPKMATPEGVEALRIIVSARVSFAGIIVDQAEQIGGEL